MNIRLTERTGMLEDLKISAHNERSRLLNDMKNVRARSRMTLIALISVTGHLFPSC
jgi:hypothetical protein